MLVTDKGQLIRCPVEDIRIAGRSTQGVIVFNTADDEHVVSVEHIGEEAENGNGNGNGNGDGNEGRLPLFCGIHDRNITQRLTATGCAAHSARSRSRR